VSPVSDDAIRRLRVAARWPAFDGTRYTVVEEIGRGGMGTVYLAIDDDLQREVAIKVSNAVASPALAARLHTEARVLAQLEHPGIVPVHDVGQLADGRLFYVMKRVRGRTLLEHLGEVSDPGERLRIFERICEPVAFAHAHGIIHRDLKPENVMVGAFGEVLVVDWGVAKTLGAGAADASRERAAAAEDPSDAPGSDRSGAGPPPRGQTEPGTVLGTRGFMSPEQASGAADAADERSDIYGLGAMLFTLLTGTLPPEGSSVPLAQHLEQHRRVPRRLRAIGARALALDPGARYQTVAALAEDVARFRAGRAVDAYRETPLERTVRLVSVYRTPILLVLAYLIMRIVVAVTVGR
jgi:serine/threonine protein kinase